MDADGYPEDEELDRIRTWPHDDLHGLLAYVKERWWQPTFGWDELPDYLLRLSTGGWSGNESLIEAMQENFIFWNLCWESSRRGGHFTFDLTRIPKKEA